MFYPMVDVCNLSCNVFVHVLVPGFGRHVLRPTNVIVYIAGSGVLVDTLKNTCCDCIRIELLPIQNYCPMNLPTKQ